MDINNNNNVTANHQESGLVPVISLVDNEIHIFLPKDEEKDIIEISLYLTNTSNLNTLKRDPNEILKNTLIRILKTYEKKNLIKKKKNKNIKKNKNKNNEYKKYNQKNNNNYDDNLCYIINPKTNEILNPEEYTNLTGWKDGYELHLYHHIYYIRVNPPRLLSLYVSPQKNLLTGCAIISHGEYEYANGIEFEYLRKLPDQDQWEVVSKKKSYYILKDEDINCNIKVRAWPILEKSSKLSIRNSLSYINNSLSDDNNLNNNDNDEIDTDELEENEIDLEYKEHHLTGEELEENLENHIHNIQEKNIDNHIINNNNDNDIDNDINHIKITKIVGRSITEIYIEKVTFAPLPKSLEIRDTFLTPLISIEHLTLNDPIPFRFITYNVLADPYATSEHALEVIYPYVDPDYLHTDYRRPQILRELLNYHADLICLQECDKSFFKHYLNPCYNELNYKCIYTNKKGQVAEGCTMLINLNKFKFENLYELDLKELVKKNQLFQNLLNKCPNINEIATEKVTTIAQIAVISLKDRPWKKIIIVNTHLYYHPRGHSIRLMQVVSIIEYIKKIKLDLLNEYNKEDEKNLDLLKIKRSRSSSFHKHELDISIMFCGDLNSQPDSGLIQYLQTSIVLPEHSCWNDILTFSWGKENINFLGFSTESKTQQEIKDETDKMRDYVPVLIDDTVSFISTYPINSLQYTNYVVGFVAILDYIFIQENKFNILQIGDIPNRTIISEHSALPSPYFFSDHISLIADLEII